VYTVYSDNCERKREHVLVLRAEKNLSIALMHHKKRDMVGFYKTFD